MLIEKKGKLAKLVKLHAPPETVLQTPILIDCGWLYDSSNIFQNNTEFKYKCRMYIPFLMRIFCLNLEFEISLGRDILFRHFKKDKRFSDF